MLGERKSSMCRSRVARGHFTLMAAGPIEMTAALHDLKVRRQRIIFQWWRRRIGGVKWYLPPLLLPLLLLLSWIIAEQPRWNQHSTKPQHHYSYTQHNIKHIALLWSSPWIHIIARISICDLKQHNKTIMPTLPHAVLFLSCTVTKTN